MGGSTLFIITIRNHLERSGRMAFLLKLGIEKGLRNGTSVFEPRVLIIESTLQLIHNAQKTLQCSGF